MDCSFLLRHQSVPGRFNRVERNVTGFGFDRKPSGWVAGNLIFPQTSICRNSDKFYSGIGGISFRTFKSALRSVR